MDRQNAGRGDGGGRGYSDRGRGSYSDRGGRGGSSDRGGRGGYSDRGGRGGYTDRGGHGGYSDRGGHGGYSDRGGRGGYGDRGDRGGYGYRGGRGQSRFPTPPFTQPSFEARSDTLSQSQAGIVSPSQAYVEENLWNLPQKQSVSSPQPSQEERVGDKAEEQQADTKQESKKKTKQKKKQASDKETEEVTPSSKPEEKASSSKAEEKVPSSKAEEKPPSTSKAKLQGDSSVLTIPKRKNTGVGTVGIKFSVETNFLQLKFKKMDAKIYHYDVEIKPLPTSKQRLAPKRLFRRIVMALIQRHFPRRQPAFDGVKNMYACPKLEPMRNDQLEEDVEINDPETGRDCVYNVAIKLVAEVTIRSLFQYMDQGTSFDIPQGSIQALDIALRSRPASLSITVGRSFFTEPTDNNPDRELGDGLELWDGMFQSCVLGWKLPYLNVDVAHKGFPRRMTLVEYFEQYCNYNGQELSFDGMNTARQFLVGLKLEMQLQAGPRRTFKVREIGRLPKLVRFRKTENDPEITVFDYFERDKHYRIRHPNLPCMVAPQGSHFPPELCSIINNQTLNKKLTENQTARIVKYAARPAFERKQRILNFVRRTQYNNDATMREFGIEVDENFISVDARIMPGPMLLYSQNKIVQPVEGVWRQDRFLNGAILKTWAIVNLDTRTRQDGIQNLIRNLVTAGNTCGIAVQDTRLIETSNPNTLQKTLTSLVRANAELQLVVIILADRPGLYGQVKRAAEMSVGVLTQCIKSKTVYKMNFSTAQNLLLKINTKLNGVNHRVHQSPGFVVFSEPTMVIGADVTHPSPDQTEIPSIAGVATSYDAYGYRYMMEYRLQPPRVEIIQDLQQIMMLMFKKFEERTKHRPRKIFFYRDGVSEGQFYDVLTSELTAIRSACRKLWGNHEPGITFIVVQKRHHTRFFPKDRRFSSGRNGNVPPGTCVDTIITHPTECDFYLVSHASIQGTARPTKYHLLHDDNNLDADKLQFLTYHLCYLFSRCNRSVSYPAPTYYAHLIAFRARAYMESVQLRPGDIDNLNTERHCGLVKDSILQNTPMFYV